MAVLVFRPGGPTLDLGSDAFRERALRLSPSCRYHVDDLVLDLTVREPTRPVGPPSGGSARDLHVEGAATAHPVLFHDLPGDDWLDQLRRHVAPHLADLIDNAARAATLALLLQHDDYDERQAWLLDRGIGDTEMDQVRGARRRRSRGPGRTRRWWRTLLPCWASTSTCRRTGTLPRRWRPASRPLRRGRGTRAAGGGRGWQ